MRSKVSLGRDAYHIFGYCTFFKRKGAFFISYIPFLQRRYNNIKIIMIKLVTSSSILNWCLNIIHHFLTTAYFAENSRPTYKKVISIFSLLLKYLFKHNFFIFQNYKILNFEAQIFNICIDLYVNR